MCSWVNLFVYVFAHANVPVTSIIHAAMLARPAVLPQRSFAVYLYEACKHICMCLYVFVHICDNIYSTEIARHS